MSHPNHIFLIDHHTIGFGHNFEQNSGRFAATLRKSAAKNIGLHHSGTGYAGAYHRTGGHQSQIILYLKFAHQHTHSRRLHIKASNGAGLANQTPGGFIIFEYLCPIEVDGCFTRTILSNQGERIRDFGQSTLTEYIEFMQTRIFRNIHVELGGRESLGWQKGGAKMLNGISGNQNPARMYAQVIGESVEPFSILQNQTYYTIVAASCRSSTRQCLSFVWRQAQYLGQFANQGAVLKCDVCTQKSNIRKAMKNIGYDMVAFLPGKVNIEIGRIAAIQIDEALEIKVQFDEIDLSNLKQVSHQAVGPAAPAYIKEATTAGIFQYFPID